MSRTKLEAIRLVDRTEQTYYRWSKEYGSMNTTDVKSQGN
jgi:hypothetical protein